MPENLDQLAALAAEDVKISAMRIALECFLHQQRQRVHTTAHVGMPRRDPYLDARRNRDHHRRPRVSAATTAVSVAGSTAPEIRIRAPAANSISIVPRPAELVDGASPAICTDAKPVGASERICRRQPK